VHYALPFSGGFYPDVGPDFKILDYLNIMDYRDVEVKEWDVERTVTRSIDKIYDIVKAGAIPLMFGGDHSIPYPVMKAISDNREGKTASSCSTAIMTIALAAGRMQVMPLADFLKILIRTQKTGASSVSREAPTTPSNAGTL
jgi:hypothetical protein